MRLQPTRTLLLLAAVGMLSACAYSGGDIGNPFVRKAEWFSYIEGADIRRTCAAGTPDRYRLVYNGIYDQQLRMYDVDSIRKILHVRVTTPGSASRLTVDNPLGPWTATEAKIQLSADAYAQLVAALDASGMKAPPPVGLQLPSRSYFWTAAFCADGQYGFTAWKYPSPAFDRISFDRVLFSLDPTGVKVAKAEPIPYDPVWESDKRQGEVMSFTMAVGRDGLLR